MQIKNSDIGIQFKEVIENRINIALNLCHNSELSRKSVVRELRRNIKNVRSIFKLFKPVISELDYHIIDEQIGNMNHALTIQREASVNLKIYRIIEKYLSDRISEQTNVMILNELKNCFNLVYSNNNNAFNKIIINISFRLSRLNEKIQLLSINEYSEGLFYLVLEKTFLKTARLYYKSKMSLQTKVIHKWKIFNKHLTNQIIFFFLFHNNTFDKLIQDLEALTALLGKEHDLAVFCEYLMKNMNYRMNKKEKIDIQRIIDSERRKLQKAALIMGNSLFANHIDIPKPQKEMAL